ncbi:MAG: GNAT family N-acetyltransferase [Chloroflexota bacterium]
METHPTVTPTNPLTDGMVLLRLPDEGDIAAVYRYGQDPDIKETAWLPIPFLCPQEVAARTVQEFQQGWHGRYGLTLIITMPPDDDLRGVVHLSLHAAGTGEIAYGVALPHRRQELAARAVTLASAWAFRELGLTGLEIVVTARGAHGLASRRVAEKAGFIQAGIRRSHLPATGRDYEDPLYILSAPGSGA